MNFGLTEEQELLRQEVRKFLDEQCPIAEVRRIMETPEGYSPELWKQLAELGWLGLIIPDRYGGAGGDWIDLVVVLEETGRTLFPSPLISTTLAASAILEAGSDAQKERWLPGLADGSRIGTLAILEEVDSLAPSGVQLRGEPDGDGYLLRGDKRFVADAGAADLFVVAFRTGDGEDDLGLAVVDGDAPGVSLPTAPPTIDASKRVGDLVLEGVRIGPDSLLGEPGAAGPALARLLDCGAVAVTAEMIGSADGAHAITVQYAKDRIQFGHPIGHFQGVKHPLAEDYVHIESFKSLLYYAAWAIEASPAELSLAASRAKAYAAQAFTQVGIDGIQLHGAVGYTLEFDIQLYLKRSKWARPAFGDAEYHLDRVATLGGY
ncbi:MAG: acyl-CoA dehydrogenase [Myxococcota bacterium]